MSSLPVDLDAGQPGRLLVAADRVHGATRVRAVEYHRGDDAHHHHHDHRDRQVAAEVAAQGGHGFRHRDRAALRDDQCQAAGDAEHGQRGDERRQLPVRDERGVDQPGHRRRPPATPPRPPARARPASVAVQARVIAESAATEPTDRSMPPVTMTNVEPKARIAVTAACTPTLSRLVTAEEVRRQQRQRHHQHDERGQRAVLGEPGGRRGAAGEHVTGHDCPPLR